MLPTPGNTRERILHAAVTVLNDEGFGALTQQRVCTEAGVRQSHLTYYFPTRNDLLRETVAYSCEAMMGPISRHGDAGVLTLDALREVMTTSHEDRRWSRLMTALMVASDEDDRIKPWLAAFDQRMRDNLRGYFASVGLTVTDVEVEVLHAAFAGAILTDLAQSTPDSLARAQRVIRTVFESTVAAAQARAGTPRKKVRKP